MFPGEGTTINLYLIRHADALALGEGGSSSDADRPLSSSGELQAEQVGKGLRQRGIPLEVVLASPLLRARQTAERIVGQWSAAAPELQTIDELLPGTKRKKVVRCLRKLGKDSVALVGHQPDLGELVAWLIGSKKAHLDVAKAGMAYIAFDDGPRKGAGMLRWLVTPEWFGKDSPG